MLYSLLIYSLLISYMVLCSITYANMYPGKIVYLKNPVILLLLLVFSFVIGCRYGVGGIDYFHYLDFYESCKVYLDANSSEYLFYSFTKYLSINNVHFAVYFGIIAFIQMAFFISAYKQYPKILPYAIVFFFIGSYYLGWCNVMRQNIVIAVSLYSISLIIEKRYLLYYLLTILCLFIHSSAALLLILYPVLILTKNIFPNRYIQYLSFGLCFCIGYFTNIFSLIMSNPIVVSLFVSTNYASYFNNEEIGMQGMDNTIGLGYLLHVTVWCIIIGFSSKLKSFYNNLFFDYCYKLFFVGCCLFVLFTTSIVLQRFALYFYSFELIIVPFFFYYLLKAPFNYYIRLYTFAFCFFSYFLLFLSEIINGDKTLATFHFFWEV